MWVFVSETVIHQRNEWNHFFLQVQQHHKAQIKIQFKCDFMDRLWSCPLETFEPRCGGCCVAINVKCHPRSVEMAFVCLDFSAWRLSWCWITVAFHLDRHYYKEMRFWGALSIDLCAMYACLWEVKLEWDAIKHIEQEGNRWASGLLCILYFWNEFNWCVLKMNFNFWERRIGFHCSTKTSSM